MKTRVLLCKTIARGQQPWRVRSNTLDFLAIDAIIETPRAAVLSERA